jgi:uncharacterized protein (TIGR02145 family)
MKRYIIYLAVTLITLNGFTQAPLKFSYQAVVRNASGELVKNSTVNIQISILQGYSEGDAVYVETHTPVTNDNGLISIQIGNGYILSGNMTLIDWSYRYGGYYLKTDIDPTGGNTYTITSTTQLLSVPYALYAKTSEQGTVVERKINMLYNTVFAGGILTDIEGNKYNIVKIGDQTWMAESLKATKYNDGTEIAFLPGSEWWMTTGDGYCIYGNSFLYNGYVCTSTNIKNVCPSGWRVPSSSDWNTLISYVGGADFAGYKLKESGSVWVRSYGGASNEAGFSALPVGYRSSGGIYLQDPGMEGDYWSSTEIDINNLQNFRMTSGSNSVSTSNETKNFGASVRCILDN